MTRPLALMDKELATVIVYQQVGRKQLNINSLRLTC
jgi:hypothetical protein